MVINSDLSLYLTQSPLFYLILFILFILSTSFLCAFAALREFISTVR
jgi:hypothetical protein